MNITELLALIGLTGPIGWLIGDRAGVWIVGPRRPGLSSACPLHGLEYRPETCWTCQQAAS